MQFGKIPGDLSETTQEINNVLGKRGDREGRMLKHWQSVPTILASIVVGPTSTFLMKYLYNKNPLPITLPLHHWYVLMDGCMYEEL